MVATTVGLQGCTDKPARAPARPFGVLLVTIDTMRADHLSAYGYQKPTSPVLEALAERGTRFAKAYATFPGTDASHTSMLTGQYPRSHGLRRNGARTAAPQNTDTLALRLRAAGYSTASITARVGLDPAKRGIRGFDATDAPTASQKWRKAQTIVKHASSHLEDHGDSPWFLWVHLWEPHKPYAPSTAARLRFYTGGDPPAGDVADPPRFLDAPAEVPVIGREKIAQSTALYDAEISEADVALGHILEVARAHIPEGKGLLTVVTSDHGETLGERQLVGEGFGHGSSLYEEAMRVPWVAVWEGVIRRQVVAPRVSLVDLAPTLVDLLGIGAIEGAQGRSLAATLRDGAVPQPRPVFLERLGTKYSQIESLSEPEDGVIDGNWKLLRDPAGKRLRLFNLAFDPLESKDLAGSKPEKVAVLETLLERFHERAPLAAGSEGGESPEQEREREALRSLGYLD